MKTWHKILLSGIFFVAVWLFWWRLYPYSLTFREQNQMLLLSWQYLAQRLALPGGLADYLSEFILQFAVVIPLCTALLAALMSLIQIQIAALCGPKNPVLSYVLSFIPSILLVLYSGNIYSMFSFPVAICLALACCLIFSRHRSLLTALVTLPLLWWAAGPAVWVFILFAIIENRKALPAVILVLAGAAVTLASWLLLRQYPLAQVSFGILYYSVTMVHPAMQHIILACAAAIPLVARILPESDGKLCPALSLAAYPLLLAGAWLAVPKFYNPNLHELIRYDQLVRYEKWEELVARAEKSQPQAEIGCVSVNLALFMSDQMNRFDDFYQCGTKGLLMPRVRDFISNTSTGEAFWRMGFINEALRYAFDTQESNPTLRKNPRSMMRMAECQILNGRYKVASKYLDLLKKTMFYRRWALEEEKYLYNEGRIEENPLYAYLLSIRLEDDFLYYYPHMEKMLTRLYLQNNDNIMAGSYLIAWKKLLKETENDEKADDYGVHGN